MKSSSGEHYIALDHVRALAAFMVFAWHFIHSANGYPVPFGYLPTFFPFALLDEGHTGVALFMTLSGYLFAKLLDGKTIHYGDFLWNRFLRLVPLLALVIFFNAGIEAIAGKNLREYFDSIAMGIFLPTLPNNGWSITAEFHYYLILPLFLWLFRKSRFLPLLIVAAAVLARAWLHAQRGEIQSLAYWTIVGRIDQFALGMIFFQFRSILAWRHCFVIGTLIAFSLFYFIFDSLGGFYNNPAYPSSSPLWILMPTVEGAVYATAISWYDSSFTPRDVGISRFVGRLGVYSYSIYLLHLYVVFRAAKLVDQRIMNLSNFYVACLWALVFFLLMMPVGYLSFRFVEAPFLKLRRRYTIAPDAVRVTT